MNASSAHSLPALELPALCEGWVSHQRLRPARHAFAHKVFFLRVPVSAFGRVGNRWLSTRRFNLLGFIANDFGPRDGSDPRAWVDHQLALAGQPAAEGEIVLQAFPRVLGYVFNPISLWLVHDREARLRAVVCEVSNTFGERHNYVVAHPDGRPIGARDVLCARKLMHVSPFCEVKGHYRFRFGQRAGKWTTTIDYHDGPEDADRLLITSIVGGARPLTARSTLSAFLRYPAFTLGVIARIHWHALLLWMKRVPWFSKPAPPLQDTSF